MILDTNIYTALANNVPSAVAAIENIAELTLPIPVIAELIYGFAKGSRTEYNEQVLLRFISQPQVPIAIPDIRTTEHYTTIQLFCQQEGKALSQNDIWITALALQANDTLATFDKDLAPLAELFGDKLLILE